LPDKRSHRGAHPEDIEQFGPESVDRLRAAAADYALTRRQRVAVARATCASRVADLRRNRELADAAVAGKQLLIDGFNVVVTLEAALAGGVILKAVDGCYRDMSSMHGSYRRTRETQTGLTLVGDLTQELAIARCVWYFDRPVSNSGRLARMTSELAAERNWPWQAEVVNNPDAILRKAQHPVATADSVILNDCEQWFNLARKVVDRYIPNAWIVDVTGYAP
jgi:hypothetical protein